MALHAISRKSAVPAVAGAARVLGMASLFQVPGMLVLAFDQDPHAVALVLLVEVVAERAVVRDSRAIFGNVPAIVA